MRLCIITAGIALLLATTAAERATAQVISQGPYVRPQQYNPYRRPAFSPYLNLARGGNPAINYYGLVRPQMEMQTQMSQLQQQQAILQQNQFAGQQGQTGGVPITGRGAGFLTHSGYFQNWQGRSGGAPGAGMGPGFGMSNAGGLGNALPGTVGALSAGVSRPGQITAPRPQGPQTPRNAQPSRSSGR